MATTALGRLPVSRKLVLISRVLLVLIALVLLVTAAFGIWFYQAASAALPQLDGSISVKALSAPVTINRDAQGVPHITAASMEDLMFAQGYVTAQDRLWQMDVSRRFGLGELAEILGPDVLRSDKRHRILQLRFTAERALATLPERDRRLLDAYARGVNALMESQRKHLPIEFRVLRYAPRSWTPVDSIIVGINISESLSTSFPGEYAREKLQSRLAPELAADLYPNSSWRDRPPSALPRDQQFPPLLPTEEKAKPDSNDESRLAPFETEDLCDTCMAGSNNWVVSGAHTTTGKPLLSNDMHLNHSIPNVWYEAHLHSGDYDVAGVSFPGFPFIIAGHNQRIAWGMTNLGPDVQDLFIENFNSTGEYESPAGWQKTEHRREVIKVKGAADEVLDVLVTRHGPIVSDIFPGESRKLALQWTIYDPHALTFNFYNLGLAHNWQEFRAAVSGFGGATQNIVYADVDGHIGYQAAGFIPIRASGTGGLPVPGNDDSHAWTGYVPFDKLPSVYDPPSGVIGTANGRVTPDGYPYQLANEWGSPYRTERIYKLLESGKTFSPADMLGVQMDNYSEFDRVCADHFVYAIDHSKHASTAVHQAADVMRGWDGHTSVDSVAATLSVLSRRKLWKMILEPKLGAEWEQYQWFNSSVAMEKLLSTKPRRWLPSIYANFDDLLVAAVDAAITDKTNVDAYGKDISKWQWGKFSRVDIRHPIFGSVPLLPKIPYLKNLVGPGDMPQSGNGSLTVKAAGKVFGASERMTTDFSNLDASNLNIVVGQSGQVLSSHYLDQWPAWYRGTSFKLPFSPEQVNKAAVHKLTLVP
jgi:penicillin amidase